MKNQFGNGSGKVVECRCSICGGLVEPWPGGHGFGNNPQPVRPDINDRCCNRCNAEIVIPARLGLPPGSLGSLEEQRSQMEKAMELFQENKSKLTDNSV